MKRVSRAVSSSTPVSKSRRFSGVSVASNSRSVVTAPVIEASGVLRSCDSDASSVERRRSLASRLDVRIASRDNAARSSAIAVWSRISASV